MTREGERHGEGGCESAEIIWDLDFISLVFSHPPSTHSTNWRGTRQSAFELVCVFKAGLYTS